MRKLILFVILFSPLITEISAAQHDAVTIRCAACRDANLFPDDVANFAFNQIYGPESWMTLDQADDFYVIDSLSQRVYVDVDLVFIGFGFQGLRLPIWPLNLLEFTLALPNGEVFITRRSVFHSNLPVPVTGDTDQTDRVSGSTGSGRGDEGDDDDGGDAADYEWQEPEIEYEGFVFIEDPDEDGNFPDWEEWCEEC